MLAKLSILTTIAALALAACGGDDPANADWDAEVASFADTICACGADVDGCTADVLADMDDARAAVGPEGEAACVRCMRAKTDAADDCDLDAAEIESVNAACDTDPTTDFDGDGTPDNDDDEACAGFP